MELNITCILYRFVECQLCLIQRRKTLIQLSIEVNGTPIPIPHRTIHEPKGQDLDYINIANNHLLHYLLG